MFTSVVNSATRSLGSHWWYNVQLRRNPGATTTLTAPRRRGGGSPPAAAAAQYKVINQ